MPLQPAVHKTRIQAALTDVESGGRTALFDGWEAGARQLKAGTRLGAQVTWVETG